MPRLRCLGYDGNSDGMSSEVVVRGRKWAAGVGSCVQQASFSIAQACGLRLKSRENKSVYRCVSRWCCPRASRQCSSSCVQRRCHPHFRRVRVSLQEYVPSITPFRSLSASAKHMATTSAGMPITRTGGRGAIRRGRGGSSIVVCRPIRPELTPPPSPEHTRRIPRPATEASHGPRATRAASCFFNHRINRMQGVFLSHRSAAPAVLQPVEWSDARHLQ